MPTAAFGRPSCVLRRSVRGATLGSVAQTLIDLIVPGTDPDVLAAYASLRERATTAVFGFEDEVCVVDVETTGYDAARDRVIEVAAARMRGPEVLERFGTLVDPGTPIPEQITMLTGIDDAMVRGAPSPEEALLALAAFIGDRPAIAHNAPFDRAFVEAVLGPGAVPGPWVDTLVLARIAFPRLKRHRLVDLAAAFAPGLDGTRHRAAADVEALCTIWRCALTGIADLDPGTVARLARLAPGAEWPERDWIARIAGLFAEARPDTVGIRRRRARADLAEALEDASDVELSFPQAEEVAAAFTAAGVAGSLYDSFEERPEQVQMALAVLDAFSSARIAAIEAGTGTGKSLAYLLPAALTALRNGIGIGVATKTNALMDQLVHREIPRLNEALGGGLRSAALKGYEHYLCLRKLERHAADLDAAASPEHIAAVAALLAWVDKSSWGDLDAVNVHWDRALRAAVQATRAECTRKRCRFYPHLCYLHGVRRRALSSHLVVTNHALFFRDLMCGGNVLPPIRFWVIDEAHAVEQEARKQLALGASHARIAHELDALSGRRGGVIEASRRGLGARKAAAGAVALVARLVEEAERCSRVNDSCFAEAKALAAGGEYDTSELWIDDRLRGSPAWARVASVASALLRRIDAVVAAGNELMRALEEHDTDEDARADLAGHLSRLVEQREALATVMSGEDERLVYSATIDRRPTVDAEEFAAALYDVGGPLADDLYPGLTSVVFTSATLVAGDSFAHFARSVGLDELSEERWFALQLPSSYDLERQMTVYVATDVPDPREPGYAAALERLLEGVHVAMGGSVLTLFTNRREMERIYDSLRPRLIGHGLDVIVQRRTASARRLSEEFIADERLSLFALKSFWEGFDAKGDTLRCVVVPRLSFRRPDDPLSRERERREGKAAWARYTLPEAVIELRQAAGRLIRSATDTGCLVIADSRVVSQSYGALFLSALPVSEVHRMTSAEIVESIERRFGADRPRR